jgi:6-phosphogluconolactonase
VTHSIFSCSAKQWTGEVVSRLQAEIIARIRNTGSCSVMLTGGRSAARLYAYWGALPEFRQLNGVSFYFGDERCVPPDHADSNYRLALDTLFQGGVPSGCVVFRMEADSADIKAAATRYERLLPAAVDVLLLSVGDDGHIASLFPKSAVLFEHKRRVRCATSPRFPFDRLTITPKVLSNARSVFVLATGAAKAKVLHRALSSPGDFASLPARMVLQATWLLDSAFPPDIS